MHPIERLRYVARSSGAPQDVLVRETAIALAAFRDEPSGLVTACRRIVSRQLTCGAIWWLCSRMLCAVDPLDEARRAVEQIEADPTARHLAAALPFDARVAILGWPPHVVDGLVQRGDIMVWVVDLFGDAASVVRVLEQRDIEAEEVSAAGLGSLVSDVDVVLLEAAAMGPDIALCPSGSRAAAAVARHARVPVWMTAGVGRVLPSAVIDTIVSRLESFGDPWHQDDEIVPLDLIDRVVGPAGLEEVRQTVARTDCPIAPELFRADIT